MFIYFTVVWATCGYLRTPAYFRMLSSGLRKTDLRTSQEIIEAAAKEVTNNGIPKESRVSP
jgi:hypothetical protein